MGASFSGDDDVISDINITPFVDIILVVLIIFMVTATTIVKEQIEVSLPDAATADPATESTSLGLTLTSSGRLLLDGEDIDVPTLTTRLAEAKAAGDVVCLISADKAVAHGRVVWLIDLIRSQGIGKFALNVDKAELVPPDPATLGEGRATLP